MLKYFKKCLSMQLYYFYLGRKKIDYSETNNVSLFA